jgi:hypothetical protein
MSNARWILVAESDGARGANGKKKAYEITLDGNKVKFAWGMAEVERRQTTTLRFFSTRGAEMAAREKLYSKLGNGYSLVYQA